MAALVPDREGRRPIRPEGSRAQESWASFITGHQIHREIPQEEIPSHVPGVGEPSLCDLRPDGVGDGRLPLICEQMGDGVARRDELRQIDQEVLIHQLSFQQQQQQHPVSLHRQEVQQTAAFTFQRSSLWLLMPKCSTSSELFYNVRI